MSRVVELTFDGNSRGVVGAATETVTALRKVREATAQSARDNIVARVQERQSLERLATEYTKVAQNAKRGSEVQVAAFKLEQQALRQLSEEHAVHSRRLQHSTRDAERFGKGMLIGSGALGHLGRTAAIASGSFLGGLGVIEVFRRSTHEGSSLATQLERTSKVFGDQAGVIKKWSKDSVDALGLARSETLLYASDIGQLLANMKLAPAAAAAMSKGLLQRAADVATEKNVPTGDVVGAFTAAINGQTRGLREYGIALDGVMVKREAERLGLVKNTVDLGKVHDATVAVQIAKYNLGVQEQKHGVQSAEAAKATLAVHAAEKLLAAAQTGHAETLTKAQRAQATYNAILTQTGNQQGYIAGHTNDLAVQQRKLHAEIKTLYEQMGAGLIPKLTEYLPRLTDWIDKNEKNGNFQREFNKALGIGGDIVSGVVPVIKGAATAFGKFADAVGGSSNAIEILGAGFVGYKMTKGLLGVINHVKELRLALLALADGTVLGVLGALGASLAAVLATSGDAANVPSTTDAKGRAKVVADLAKAGKFTNAQILEGSAAAGIDKNTPFGRAMQNPKFVDALYKLAGASGLLPNPGTGFRSGDLGSPGAIVAGVTGPITSGLSALEKQVGGHVTDDYAKAGHNKNSYHYKGQAIDLAPDPAVWAKLYARKDAFAELFGPTSLAGGGLYSKGVQFYDDKLQGEHQNHIHVAYTGGVTEIDALFSASTATTTTGGTGDTGGTGTFVEKGKPPKKHADPIASYRTALKTGIAQINDDVDKGLLPKDVGDRLDARAAQIQKSLVGATKADIPKIRTQMKDLNAAVSSALRATRDQALLGKDIGQVRTDVKGGLLSKAVGDSLIAQAKAINARLVRDIFDPKKSAADDAAARGFRARIAAMLSQAAEVRTIDSDLSKAALANAQALEGALGIPVEHATEGAVAKAKAGIAAIRAEFASNKIIPAAERTKLKQQLAAYEATVGDGMQGVIDTVTLKRTKFETAWSRLSSAAFSAFDKETSRHLSKMQADAKKAIDAIEVTVAGSGFASFLFGGGAQTPTEKLLAQRAAAKQKADDIQSIADATKALADAQAALAAYSPTAGTAGVAGHDAITNAAGDSVTGIGVAGTPGSSDLASLQQAVVDAQKALDNAKYQQETDDLSAQAQLERDAADKQLSAAQDAAQKLADQQAQDYQDQRDAQRQHIQDMLDNELQQILEGKKTLGQAMAELGGTLGMNLAQAFATWFDPANPDSVTATLAGFLYQVELAKGKTSSQAAVAALGSLPPASYAFGAAAGVDYSLPSDAAGWAALIGGGSKQLYGFASGGWADQGRPAIDPRDTIPALLKHGEYVMSEGEVQAGGPSWARGRGGGDVYLTGDVIMDGEKVGRLTAVHVTNAQERQIFYRSGRA